MKTKIIHGTTTYPIKVEGYETVNSRFDVFCYMIRQLFFEKKEWWSIKVEKREYKGVKDFVIQCRTKDVYPLAALENVKLGD